MRSGQGKNFFVGILYKNFGGKGGGKISKKMGGCFYHCCVTIAGCIYVDQGGKDILVKKFEKFNVKFFFMKFVIKQFYIENS